MTDATNSRPVGDSDDWFVNWLVNWIETAHFDRVVWLNMISFFLGAWVFGAPGWKCAVIAVAVGFLSKARYGRGILTKLGIVIALLTILEWSEIFPPARQMFSRGAQLLAGSAI